tara:strand:+ start:253 stop:1005 length:753 start_codon:yes stop_codon:yes gene_type:complete
MAKRNSNTIKDLVKEHYSEKAVSALAIHNEKSGKSPITSSLPLYNQVDTSNLSPQVLGASAGCGNPVALADIKSGETIVDLGSGGGIDCFLAAEAVGPNGKVIGVDMTPKMLEVARKAAKQLKAHNVEFREGEIEDLPIESETVDLVISNCVICLSVDKDSVVNEAFRILRSGGRFHVSDMLLRGELPDEIKTSTESWVKCVAGADNIDIYINRLEKAGFSSVTIEEEKLYSNEPGMENLRSMLIRALKN